MNKRKNYMIKFGLSLSLVIIFPILIIGYLIAIIIRLNYEAITINDLLMYLLIIFLSFGISLILSMILGYITYRIDKTDIISENDNIITTGRLMINKNHITCIKAKKFIFLYEFVIYTKPWKRLPMLTYYFYNKEELISFINENELFIEYIRKEDLIKLGINKSF